MIQYRFKCMECGKKFRSTAAAERAALNGCPDCGRVDVDIDPEATVMGSRSSSRFSAESVRTARRLSRPAVA